MDKEQYITKLTAMWYRLVSLDHHKDRDCHFYINKVWSYGHEPYYSVEHYGYIYDKVEGEFDTYEEAEQFLLDAITHSIKCEEKWAKKVLGETEDWMEEDIKKAKDILEIIRKYTDGK